MDTEWNDDILDEEFNSTTRELVIYFLLFITLQCFTYCLMSLYKKQDPTHHHDYDDIVVNRVTLGTCSFSLSFSIGAALLLPISIMSNEILLLYPNSHYIRWLNISLIQGLWNGTFLFSNMSIFILLPFALFFSESQGFSKYQTGIKGRLYETLCVLLLVGLLIFSMIFVLCSIFSRTSGAYVPFFNSLTDYFPFLYSCLSFLGVLLLLICTPIGFAHIFTVVGNLVTEKHGLMKSDLDYISLGAQSNMIHFQELENNFKSFLPNKSFFQPLVYGFAMLLLLVFTIMSVLMVAQNILLLCFGIKTLPMYSQNFSLGITSLSILGPLGAFFEIILILYLWCSSIVGLYTLPLFRLIRPKVHDTSVVHMMANCAILLILSSALPVLARTIGITNFDLLGNFGQIHWLGNMYIVLFYNVVFAVSTVLCLGKKVTITVSEELVTVMDSLRKEWVHKRSLNKELSEPAKLD